jgi:hypothetical protein
MTQADHDSPRTWLRDEEARATPLETLSKELRCWCVPHREYVSGDEIVLVLEKVERPPALLPLAWAPLQRCSVPAYPLRPQPA